MMRKMSPAFFKVPNAVATVVFFLLAAATLAAQTVTVSIGWNQRQNISAMTPTLQVVSNSLLERTAVPHDSAYAELARINASYARFVPWYKMGVGLSIVETQAPTQTATYWDFSTIDPLVIDFMTAQAGRSVMMNFSTVPGWILADTATAPDSAYQRLGDYYARLLSWYEKGGFTDELGVYHSSGHYYHFDYWEAFNEPDQPGEGGLSSREYCRRYDTLVSAMRRIDSTIKFCGPGLASFNYAFYQYFLNPGNHKAGIPIDLVSYHTYESTLSAYFQQEELTQLVYTYSTLALRNQYRPNALVDCNEMGTFSTETGYAPTNSYWCLSNAVFAYGFAQMCLAGAQVAGMSQLMAQPGNYPDVSMVDWTTGRANARSRGLELLVRTMGPGDSLVTASTTDSTVFALGFITPTGQYKALVLNQTANQRTLVFPQTVTDVKYVDVTTNQDTVATGTVTGVKQLTMNGYAVWVATFAPVPVTFTPAPGVYAMSASMPITVSLSANSPQNTIYYTTDGTTPSAASKPYSGPITITGSTVIKAVQAGDSDIATGSYTNGTPQIANGSFETPNLGSGNYSYRTIGSGWNFISEAGISNSASPFTASSPAAPDGSQILFVQNYGRAQQFVTMNAGNYSLSLRAAQRANKTSAQTFVVLVDGKETARIKPPSTSYTAFRTDTFAVSPGQHLIELRGIDSTGADNTAFVDMVSLSPVSYSPVLGRGTSTNSRAAPVFAHGVIVLTIGNAGRLQASLTAMNGRVVASWSRQVTGRERTILRLPGGLANGVYLFSSAIGGERQSKRIMVTGND
jgi:hypothetical protein